MSESSEPGPSGSGRADPSAARADLRDFRDLHRRTWELELLISGAVVFALLQLPEALDAWFLRVGPRVSSGIETMVFLGYYVGKLIVYTLIGAFLAHLVARALWVGLIGLDSVFPGGIRWENTESGPIQKRIRRERALTIADAIERCDAVASVTFSAAFAIVLTLVVIGLLSVMLGVLALLLGIVLGPDLVPPVFWTLYVLFFLPPAIAQLLDKSLAGRIDPGGGLARTIERGIRMFYRMTGPLGRIADTITSTLASNLPRWRATLGLSVAFGVLVVFFLVKDVLVGSGALRLDGYAHFPDGDGPDVVLPQFYDDPPAPPAGFVEVPSIQAAVVEGPYLRVFVPLAASRLDATIEAFCPGTEPMHRTGLRLAPRLDEDEAEEVVRATREVLTCLEGLLRLDLDGVAVGPDLLFHVHPRTGHRGVLAMLPTAGLAPGRHTLTVHRLPRPDEAVAADGSSVRADSTSTERGDRDGPRAPWVIPFWI